MLDRGAGRLPTRPPGMRRGKRLVNLGLHGVETGEPILIGGVDLVGSMNPGRCHQIQLSPDVIEGGHLTEKQERHVFLGNWKGGPPRKIFNPSYGVIPEITHGSGSKRREVSVRRNTVQIQKPLQHIQG